MIKRELIEFLIHERRLGGKKQCFYRISGGRKSVRIASGDFHGGYAFSIATFNIKEFYETGKIKFVSDRYEVY